MTGRYELGTVVFGKWRIERKIGEGSFGTVYEIRREDFGQVYRAALKVIAVPQNEAELKNIRQEGMNDESIHGYFYGVVEDIVREFALMSHLKGMTNVVSCEDYEVIPHDNGMGWDILIRMELLTPLLEYAYDHPFSRRDIIQLGIDMCKALELCQRYNIIHRDIKPENIFVSDTGAFKLGDFGIARTVEKTMSGMSKKGTYSYMAPEVYRGGAYGFSVDTYSLGVVMYRLLNNNRLPFLPQPPEPITYSQREIALAKRMGGEQPPSPMNAGGRLGEIVLRACAFTPENRYSSPMQMRQELEAIQYGPEDAVLVYPSGDELALHENQYASQQSQVEVNTPESTRAIPAPETVEATEKTESVFGGGAVNKPALEETAEKMPEQAPENFFAPAGGEPEEFWPEEGTEKTESIFGRGPEEPDPAAAAPEPEEKRMKRVKKRSPITRITAIIAVIFILALLLPGALWVLGLVDFSGLKKSTDPVVPESLQEYEAAGTLERVYSDDGKLDSYAVRFYYEGNLSYEGIYNLQGQYEQGTGYNYDGTIAWVVKPEYDDEGKLTKTTQYDVAGNMLFYTLVEYDAKGNETKKSKYNADGSLSEVFESDSNGNEVRWEKYSEDGTLSVYKQMAYDADGNLMRSETYDADGNLTGTEMYDENGDCVHTESYSGDGTMTSANEQDMDETYLSEEFSNADDTSAEQGGSPDPDYGESNDRQPTAVPSEQPTDTEGKYTEDLTEQLPITFEFKAFLDTSWGDDEYAVVVRISSTRPYLRSGIILSDADGNRVNTVDSDVLIGPFDAGITDFYTCVGGVNPDGSVYGDLVEGESYLCHIYVEFEDGTYQYDDYWFVYSLTGSRFR